LGIDCNLKGETAAFKALKLIGACEENFDFL
jgi:hypothetical protein